MMTGISEILNNDAPHDLWMFQELFIDGEKLGLKLLYGEQPSPDGLAQSFIIGAKLMGGDDVF